MNERIKKLRKALDLTQTEFANRIGSVQNTITGYETGRRIPSNQVIALICREFNVNEEWLRTGSGEMFSPAPSGSLEALARDYGLSNGVYLLIRRFLELKPDVQKVFVDFAVGFAEDLAADQADPWTAPIDQAEEVPHRRPVTAEEEAWARAEAEAYYRELLLEKRAPGGSSASGGQSAEGTKGA